MTQARKSVFFRHFIHFTAYTKSVQDNYIPQALTQEQQDQIGQRVDLVQFLS